MYQYILSLDLTNINEDELANFDTGEETINRRDEKRVQYSSTVDIYESKKKQILH